MRLRFLEAILTAAAAILSTSCERDATDVFLYATPSQYLASPGDKIRFSLQIRSRVGALKSLEVSSFDSENGKLDLPGMELSGTVFMDDYFTTIPTIASTDTVDMNYTFTAHTGTGYTGTFERTIRVAPAKEKPLEELSSLQMFDKSSGREDAFMLDSFQPVSSGEVKNPDIILIKDGSSWCWNSCTDVMFVRQNTFDYPSATSASIKSAFTSSVRSFAVDKLVEGDIILLGRSTGGTSGQTVLTAVGAAKIVGISATSIRFNLKRIP